MAADPGLLALVLPPLRDGLRLIEAYRPAAARLVTMPVTAYVGGSDPAVSVPDIAAWAALASADFDLRVLPGGHFSLRDQEGEIVSDIVGCLARIS